MRLSEQTLSKPRRSAWNPDRSKILQRGEFKTVLGELNRKAKRSVNTRLNRVIFRLSTCCGLRASEISKINLNDVLTDSTSPWIRIRKEVGKGAKARVVPLHWDAGTLADIKEWKAFRLAQCASQKATVDSPFVCSQHKDALGHRIDRRNLRKRYKCVCRILGTERANSVTIHHGRHTFISFALHLGRNVVEVKAAAGHSSLGTTTKYAHLVDTDDCRVGDLFAFS